MINYPYQQNYIQPQQVQNGGIVRVKDETEAMNYPVAPGYSVMFIDENISHLYVKTAGLSQFDRPAFEKYKLTKENTSNTNTEYATKADIQELKARIEELTKGEKTDE